MSKEQLKTGQIAPGFAAKSYKGEDVTLDGYRGEKLWLAFFRYASCPLCNNRIHEIIQRFTEFERAGIRIAAVFQSPPERIAEYVGTQNPPFPLVSDPELELYGKYKIAENKWGMWYPRVITTFFKAKKNGFGPGPQDGPIATIPGDFLIDPEGLLWDVYYGKAISDHIPFKTVETFAADACLDMPA